MSAPAVGSRVRAPEDACVEAICTGKSTLRTAFKLTKHCCSEGALWRILSARRFHDIQLNGPVRVSTSGSEAVPGRLTVESFEGTGVSGDRGLMGDAMTPLTPMKRNESLEPIRRQIIPERSMASAAIPSRALRRRKGSIGLPEEATIRCEDITQT